MKFCEKLLNLRKSNNMSQEQLADKLGVSRQAVSKWESGSSIPDMEKMMQLCKILNCNLEDLVDDGVAGSHQKMDAKINWNQYYQEVLDFITKTLNMFWSMRFVEKVKCIIEMGFILFVLFFIWAIVGDLMYSVFDNILTLLPEIMYRIIYSVCSFAYCIFGIVAGAVLFIHIFKIRYLDYFITVEDETVRTKSIEEPIEENKEQSKTSERKFIEKKKNTIIIRDPKHSTYGFFGVLAKIGVFFIKGLLLIFAVPCIFCFVGLIFACTCSVWYLKDGVFFLGIAIALLGCILVNYLVLKIIYNFILERKYHYSRIFLILIIGLTLAGAGTSISFCNYLTFDETISESKTTKTYQEVEMKENIVFAFTKYQNVEWIVDESKKNVQIEIEHYDFQVPILNYYTDYDYSESNSEQAFTRYFIYHIHFNGADDFLDNLNWITEQIRNRRRIDFDSEELYQVKIYATSANINQLKENYQKFYS